MSTITSTTSGALDQYDISLDIADESLTNYTTLAAGFPYPVTVVNQGSFATTSYQYEIVSTQVVSGHAYLAWNSSSMRCNSSVAVLSRSNAFSSIKDSSADLTSCAALIAQRGVAIMYSSSAIIRGSVSTQCDTNFLCSNSSSINAVRSASVFPLRFGVETNHNSSFMPVDFESTTFNFNSMNVLPTPTHFRSINNSYCDNVSFSLTGRTLSAGFSGQRVESKPLNFVWSQISTSVTGTAAANILGNPAASYRFVPFSHSVDYSNIVTSSVVQASTLSPTGLLSVISRGRDCYASVKPPPFMFKPEDASGNTGLGGGLTGDFSIFDLITST